MKNTKIANITDTLMINTNLNSIFLGSFIGSKRGVFQRERKEREVFLVKKTERIPFKMEQTSAVVGIYEGDFPRDQVRHIFSGRPSSLGTRYRKALWHQPDHGEDCLSTLEQEGFISRKHGIGTIINQHVLDVKVRLDLEGISGYDSLRWLYLVWHLSVCDGKADVRTAQKLGIKAGRM